MLQCLNATQRENKSKMKGRKEEMNKGKKIKEENWNSYKKKGAKKVGSK